MNTALILGGGGMLAHELAPALERVGYQVEKVPRSRCDIADEAALSRLISSARPTLIANCAAYTKVDKAEQEPELAFQINATGAGNVARVAAEAGVPLLHLSTDYVFDGSKAAPYVESDATAPLGVYARSKHAGELAIRESGAACWLVRTGELYGDGGPNFFAAILHRAKNDLPLKVVDDQVVTPTWTRELALQLATLVQADAPAGLYHATAAGSVTWFEAAREALRFLGLNTHVHPCSTEAYGSPTPRPRYSVLAHEALEQLGLYRMRPWQQALREWLVRPS